PTIFINNPENIYAVFMVFILANILMLPLGWLCIKTATRILRTPRNILMPMILMFCVVGSFAINNSNFDIWILIGFGLLGWFLEENGFPIAPAILGMILGTMLEEHFITSMIKADNNWMAFFERPIALGLAIFTIGLWLVSGWLALRRNMARAEQRRTSAA
ncbi:MAG: tripartite tricarboxylate transporter permease, partial [Gammaproteobacteria bacterium]